MSRAPVSTYGRTVRPLDPRLLRTARAVRVHLAVTAACGVALTGLILLQAGLLARAVAQAPRLGAEGVAGAVALVAVVALARAALVHGAETAALRSAATVKSQLRRRLVAHVTGTGPTRRRSTPGGWPRWRPAGSTRSTTTSPATCPSWCSPRSCRPPCWSSCWGRTGRPR